MCALHFPSLCGTLCGMTSRGKPRPVTENKRYEDVPLTGLPAPHYDVVERLRSGALGEFDDDAAVARARALKRLHAAAKAAAAAAALMDSAVDGARAQGLSWDAIGAATETQGETVRRRHAAR
jgi:hypothetical protein